MKHWNTTIMLSIIEKLIQPYTNQKPIINRGQGGHWTDEIIIPLDMIGERQFLVLGAFNDEEDVAETWLTNITHLYLYDQSGDGITGTKDNKIRKLYYIIKDYFEALDYDLTENPDDFF